MGLAILVPTSGYIVFFTADRVNLIGYNSLSQLDGLGVADWSGGG